MPNQTDAEMIAEVLARRSMNLSIKAEPSVAETRSALRVEDVDRLLGVIERQRKLLDECVEALTIWADWLAEPSVTWESVLGGKRSGAVVVAAIRSLVEEIRHG